jgi:hypothetical protein
MTYIALLLRRALIIATSAALGALAPLCVLVVMALGPRSTDADRELLTASQPAAAEEIMMVLFEPHHFHLRHGGQTVHSESL